jgi:hypothetical protein
MKLSGQHHAPAALTPFTRWTGPRAGLDAVENIYEGDPKVSGLAAWSENCK